MANRKAKKRQKNTKKPATATEIVDSTHRVVNEEHAAALAEALPPAKKIEVLSITPVPMEPNKHLVELVVEDPPTPVPPIDETLFPLVIEPATLPQHHADSAPRTAWTWLKGLWG
jgi:hypothetical protein